MCTFHYPWTRYLNKFSDQFVEGEKQLNDMVSGERLLIDCWEYLVLSLVRYLLRPPSAPQSSCREFILFSREPVLGFRNRQRYRFGQSKHHIPSAHSYYFRDKPMAQSHSCDISPKDPTWGALFPLDHLKGSIKAWS